MRELINNVFAWRPKYNYGDDREWWVCAEARGAKLEVHKSETDDDGLHVSWKVTRPLRTLHVFGKIKCTEEGLKDAFEKGKRLAEEFSFCGVSCFL